MRILLVTDSYPPEIRSASHLMQELAEALRDRGYNVTVITSDPRYNLADGAARTPFPEFAVEEGIAVLRVRTLPHHNVNFILRGLAQLTLPRVFNAALKKHRQDPFDTVLVYTPPLPLSLLGSALKRRFGARYILNVQDIFPQNAVDLGVLRHPLLIRFFEAMERKAYRDADVITVHSEGNRSFLVGRSGNLNGKLHTLQNWIDMKGFDGEAGQDFRRQWHLEQKFILFFGGVMGPSQHLGFILDIAERVRDMDDAIFLLVGDGTEKERLVKEARERSLSNVIFKPFVSKDDYSRLVKEVDAGLVCLSPMNRTPVVPGKILGYMAAGIPVIAFLNRESDGHETIRQALCGYSAVSDSAAEGAALVRRMYRERQQLKSMGQRGYRYAEQHFSKQRIIDQVDSLVRRM